MSNGLLHVFTALIPTLTKKKKLIASSNYTKYQRFALTTNQVRSICTVQKLDGIFLTRKHSYNTNLIGLIFQAISLEERLAF